MDNILPITQYPVFARPWRHLSRHGSYRLCLPGKIPVECDDVVDRRDDLQLKPSLLPSDIPGLPCTVAREPRNCPLDVRPPPVFLLELGAGLPHLRHRALRLVVADPYGPRITPPYTLVSQRADRARLVIEHEELGSPACVVPGLASLVCNLACKAAGPHLIKVQLEVTLRAVLCPCLISGSVTDTILSLATLRLICILPSFS